MSRNIGSILRKGAAVICAVLMLESQAPVFAQAVPVKSQNYQIQTPAPVPDS
jgi:hypothetical protein